jgi:hypothetical protein
MPCTVREFPCRYALEVPQRDPAMSEAVQRTVPQLVTFAIAAVDDPAYERLVDVWIDLFARAGAGAAAAGMRPTRSAAGAGRSGTTS